VSRLSTLIVVSPIDGHVWWLMAPLSTSYTTTVVFTMHKDFNSAHFHLQTICDAVVAWGLSVKLVFNGVKSLFFIFSPKRNLPPLTLIVNNITVCVFHPEMLSAFLGLISQHDLSSIQILCHSHYPLQLLGLGFSNCKKNELLMFKSSSTDAALVLVNIVPLQLKVVEIVTRG
jgi:hypothetical protein